MKVLKGFALGILSFLLFFSLLTLGPALMVNSTVLNPRFVSVEVKRLDMSALVEEIVSEQTPQGDFTPEMQAALILIVNKLEPELEREIDAAISLIYDYLLGKTESLDLSLILKDTILNKEFIVSLVKEADVTSLLKPYLKEKMTAAIPLDQQYLVRYLDAAMPKLEPWIEEQASLVIGPVVDYILGKSQSLQVVVSLSTMKAILKTSLKDAFLQSPPPELASASPTELNQYFNDYYQQFDAEILASFVIDKSVLGSEIPTSITQALTDTEAGLTQARLAIGYFQLGYMLLIIFTLLLIAGIILIYREIRGATRELGITFLAYGALEYIAILIAKYLIRTQFPLDKMPGAIEEWLPQFFANFLRPLEMFSLGLAIAGIALIIVSYLYRPRPALP